jgi:hypothetical protein
MNNVSLTYIIDRLGKCDHAIALESRTGSCSWGRTERAMLLNTLERRNVQVAPMNDPFQNAAPCFDRPHLTGQRIAEESTPWTLCSRCHHYHNGSGFCG